MFLNSYPINPCVICFPAFQGISCFPGCVSVADASRKTPEAIATSGLPGFSKSQVTAGYEGNHNLKNADRKGARHPGDAGFAPTGVERRSLQPLPFPSSHHHRTKCTPKMTVLNKMTPWILNPELYRIFFRGYNAPPR